MTRSALVLALTTALVVALGSIAVAHQKFFVTTQAPVRFQNGTYTGEVKSQKAKCEAGRKIVIRPATGGAVVARGKSGADGTFSFNGPEPPAGTIEAIATKKRIKPKTNAHKHVCLPGKSFVIVRR